MSEEMRLVTGLVILEGLSQKEAADVLGISEPSVSRHLNLSRKWLKARLDS